MDIVTLAFARLRQLGKASIQYGIPVYDWGDLVDMMNVIKNKASIHRKKCLKCGKTYSVFNADSYCLDCNGKLI